MDTIEFKYKHLHKQIKSEIVIKPSKKPVTDTMIVYASNGKEKELYIQVITLLFDNKKDIGNEDKVVGTIHFAVKDTTEESWDRLTFGHLLHLVKEGVKECVDSTNEVIKKEYPKTRLLTHYSHAKLEKGLKDYLYKKTDSHIPPNWAMGQGGDA